jgi:hypothetical protein
VTPEEGQRLRDELKGVNQQLSKIGRESRPDARHTRQPEKQELLARKIDLERKIRALSKG